MDENGANQMQLTQNGRSYAPVFSPVGGKIAFVSEHEGDAHIYTINADGTEQQRIFFAGDFQSEHAPSFSTDGSKIVFIGTTLNGNNTNDDYYMANADGTGVPIRLTFLGGFNRKPRHRFRRTEQMF
jgi:Tol biopolymer transport system component